MRTQYLSKILGHSKISTTEKYAHVLPSNLHDAMQAVSLEVEHRRFFRSGDLISLHFLGGRGGFANRCITTLPSGHGVRHSARDPLRQRLSATEPSGNEYFLRCVVMDVTRRVICSG